MVYPCDSKTTRLKRIAQDNHRQGGFAAQLHISAIIFQNASVFVYTEHYVRRKVGEFLCGRISYRPLRRENAVQSYVPISNSAFFTLMSFRA